MDLQKVAIANNSNVSQNGQRSDSSAVQSVNLRLPFSDMIRQPFVGIGELFSNLGNHPVSSDRPNDDYRQNDENARAPSDQAVSRKDSPENTPRDDNTRADDRSDDRVEKSAPRDDNPREDHERRDKKETHAADDNEAPADDVTNDDVDNPDAAVTSSSDNDATDDTTAPTDTTPGDIAETAGANSDAFRPVLASLVATAQGSDQNQTVKDAAQNLKDVVAGSRVAKVVDVTGPQLGNNNAGTEQDVDGEAQQVLRQIVRQGTGQSNNAVDAANKPTDQTLAQQQAKMLSDSLKSNKPIKVTVNTENRAAVAVSQPSQSLSANAVAAQDGQSTTQATTGPQSNARPAQLQAPSHNAANPNGGQAQVAVQASEVAVAAAGERGIARVMAQTSAGQHGTVGGSESSNSTTTTTPGSQAQQAAATQKSQQAQAPRAAQQPQPITQQISVNITKAIAEGMDRISIQLRPSELGRVEVKLEIGQNGRVSAHIIADRPEALEALRNDSRGLEKALQDAGLQANAGDLSFSLRDQQENPDESDSDKRLADDEEDHGDGDMEAELATRLLNGDLDDFISDTRVDIRG